MFLFGGDVINPVFLLTYVCRDADVNQYLKTTLVDQQALRSYQQMVNEQVLQDKNSTLREELDRRQMLMYFVVTGFVTIIFIILATVTTLVIMLRDSKPCSANLHSQEMGELSHCFRLIFKIHTIRFVSCLAAFPAKESLTQLEIWCLFV
jgi:hypothetical protein